jgi:hypothetical protein
VRGKQRIGTISAEKLPGEKTTGRKKVRWRRRGENEALKLQDPS